MNAVVVRVLSLTYITISSHVLKEQLNTSNLEQFMQIHKDIFDLANSTAESVSFLPNAYNRIIVKKNPRVITFDQVYGLISDMK